MYYRRIKKFVGEYAAEMGGVDLIVFTGGVGENSSEMRESVCTGLEFMGVRFDAEANQGARGVNKLLSAADSKVKVAVIATDEEPDDRHRHLQPGEIAEGGRPAPATERG